MKQPLQYLILLASFSFLFAACKKSNTSGTNDSATPPNLIIGTWNLTATGEDANRNDQLDPGENDLIPVGYSLKEAFRTDLTGTVYTTLPGGNKDTTQFNYAFLNNNTQLQVTLPTGNTIAKIIKLTATSLIVYDINTDPRRIFAFVKL